MSNKPKSINEHRKRAQAIKQGLLPFTGHRSHASGIRWLRPWSKRQHQLEMKELYDKFDSDFGKECK